MNHEFKTVNECITPDKIKENSYCDKIGNVLLNVTWMRIRVPAVVMEKQQVFLECVSVTSVTQYTSVACPILPYSSTLYHKRHNLKKKNVEEKICVLIFFTNFVHNYESHRCTVHLVKSLQLLTNKCTYITFT